MKIVDFAIIKMTFVSEWCFYCIFRHSYSGAIIFKQANDVMKVFFKMLLDKKKNLKK